ncbi:MAG: hypothetical protein ABI611_14440 [Solirubrobacteraceae bacterium]
MSHHRRMFGAGALVVASLAALAGGHAGGEPRSVTPVRAEMLTVARDLPPIPAPALGGAPPALAKPAAQARRPKRHRNHAAPSPRAPDHPADPKPSSPAPAPAPAPAPRPNRGPGPAQSRGGGRSTGDHSGGSAGSGPVTPAATPVPGQLTPPPVEPPVEEDPAPDEQPAPDEEAG